jgi:NADPH:quinone reductase-like Zn-dependent oxidoreductase
MKIAESKNRAFRLHGYGGPAMIQLDEISVPTPGPGQVLVSVKAVGINSFDWKLREGFLRQAFPLALPAILGVEFAGEIVELGSDVKRFAAGDRVMTLLHGLGAYAEYIAVDESVLCRIPEALSDIEATALPISVQTAWEALLAAGEPLPGMKVLIQGGAGAVGGFAVQFAKSSGATVIVTASAKTRDYVIALGADEVIDYRTERFEDRVKDVDLVLDFVGGETIERSWSVLIAGGAIVTVNSPDIGAKAPSGFRGLFARAQPAPARLAKTAQLVAAGKVRSTIAHVFTLNQLLDAIACNRAGHAPGKIVVDFTRE